MVQDQRICLPERKIYKNITFLLVDCLNKTSYKLIIGLFSQKKMYLFPISVTLQGK